MKLISPHFFALSVADVDATAQWYQENLGLHLTQEMSAPDGSARVKILEGGGLVLELLQHSQAISIKKYVPDFNQGFLLQGIFKVGFFTDDLAGWAQRLEDKQVVFVVPSTTDAAGRQFFIVQDNNGNLLQFFAQPPAI